MALEDKPRSRIKQYRRQYLELLRYSYVGMEMGFAVGIGVAIGFYLDYRVFERTRPWLTLLFMGLGIVAAARAFFHAARKMRAEVYKEKEEDEPRSK